MTRSTLLGLALLAGLTLTAGCGEKDGDDTGTPTDDSAADDSAADDSAADDTGAAVEDCANGADDDGDGLTDCDDDDCAGDEACAAADEDCAAAGDEDGDGAADCADDDCAAEASCECVDAPLGAATGAGVASGDALDYSNDFEGACGSTGGQDAAFAWTAPEDACYSINTYGSDYDTVLRIFDACGGDEVACDDDTDYQDGLQSELRVEAAAGSTWVIVVDAFADYTLSSSDTGFDTGVASGLFTLEIDALSPDDFRAPDADLAGAVGASVAAGDLSTAEGSGLTTCGSDPSPTLLWSWTAPASGTYTFDTYGSDFDTILGLFTLGACGESELTCDDDGDAATNNESELSAEVVEGETYHIELSGYGGETGNYILNITAPE